MRKQLTLDLVIAFPDVKFYIGGALLKHYRAVVDDGKGCKYCHLRKFDQVCPFVNCDNVIYVTVLEQPCL